MKVSVWRYEDKNHKGPYFSQCSQLSKMRYEHSTNMSLRSRTPEPINDFGIGISSVLGFWQFGFPTKRAAFRWFQKWNKKLHQCGFQLKQFEVDSSQVKVSRSGKQLVFNRHAANCPI